MASQYSELIRRVFIGFPRTDGEAHLAVKQAVNDAIMALASLEEATSLLDTDTTSAVTVASQKTYHIVNDLGLTRPKSIYGIRLKDTDNVIRSLGYITQRFVDIVVPDPESNTEGTPVRYSEFGDNIELTPIPDDAYMMTIRYSQWPAALVDDTDESPFDEQWDFPLVMLAKDVANAYLNGTYVNVANQAAIYIKSGMRASATKPDHTLIARPFNPEGEVMTTTYWKDPFIKGVK